MAEPEQVVDEDKGWRVMLLVGSEHSDNPQWVGGGHKGVVESLPHESMKTGSVSLTMGKWRRLPM